jgi:4-hydroxy-tetrahydrodipicolinate reductase
MRAVIVGYGSMGREVERTLAERGHAVAARVDSAAGRADAPELTKEIAAKADIAIEFSVADAVAANARRYAALGLSAVVGTTGWQAKLGEVAAVVAGSPIGYLHGSNFSIGAHLFFALVARAARLVDPLPEYDILSWEVHHRRKKDSPSGTALSMAKLVTSVSSRKKRIVTERLDRPIAADELHVASVRGGEVPGIHTVLLDSLFDTVEITHSARSRGGFALGAVRAAEWLAGRHGMFTVDDFIADLLGGAP